MDLTQLKEAAIEATTRALQQKFDVMPSEESDEWEDEYRRQFALMKQHYAVDTKAIVRPPVSAGPALQLPELTGDREQIHWGEQVRTERDRRRGDLGEPLGEDEVGEEDRRERERHRCDEPRHGREREQRLLRHGPGNDERGRSKVIWDGPSPGTHETNFEGRGHTKLT